MKGSCDLHKQQWRHDGCKHDIHIFSSSDSSPKDMHHARKNKDNQRIEPVHQVQTRCQRPTARDVHESNPRQDQHLGSEEDCDHGNRKISTQTKGHGPVCQAEWNHCCCDHKHIDLLASPTSMSLPFFIIGCPSICKEVKQLACKFVQEKFPRQIGGEEYPTCQVHQQPQGVYTAVQIFVLELLFLCFYVRIAVPRVPKSCKSLRRMRAGGRKFVSRCRGLDTAILRFLPFSPLLTENEPLPAAVVRQIRNGRKPRI